MGLRRRQCRWILGLVAAGCIWWWAARDSNPDGSPHTPLKRARLPVPPAAQLAALRRDPSRRVAGPLDFTGRLTGPPRRAAGCCGRFVARRGGAPALLAAADALAPAHQPQKATKLSHHNKQALAALPSCWVICPNKRSDGVPLFLMPATPRHTGPAECPREVEHRGGGRYRCRPPGAR